MTDRAKRAAQEALFNAIQDQAETNMRAALKATEKAQLLRELAEAYRLTAGGAIRNGTVQQSGSSNGDERPTSGDGTKSNDSARKAAKVPRPARKAKPEAEASRT